MLEVGHSVSKLLSFIPSLAGLQDSFMTPIYCGTKHAVRTFTSSLAVRETLGREMVGK